jgi:hypothetical protein
MIYGLNACLGATFSNCARLSIFLRNLIFSPLGFSVLKAPPIQINGSVCDLCDPGMYAENGALTCLPCATRLARCRRAARVGCSPCGVGFYSNNLGSSSCETCVSGFFCPGPLTSQPVPCAARPLLSAGLVRSHGHARCSTAHRHNPSTAQRTPAFYGVIVSCVLAVVIVMLVLAVRAVRKRDKLVETTPLMGKPSSSDGISVGAASGKQSGTTLVYGGF